MNDGSLSRPGASRSDSVPGEGLIAVDALRALAAFVVVLEHARTNFFIPWSLLASTDRHLPATLFYAATRLGHIAVLVFFVLSGYLVGGPLLQRVQDRTVSFPSYFAARVSRIFTPLLPACFIAFCIGTWVSPQPESPLRILASATALNDVLAPTTDFNPPLWSISFEVWFYILAGSFAAAVMRRNHLLALTGCLLGVLVFTQLPAVFFLFWGLGALSFHFRAELASPRAFAAGFALWLLGAGAFETLKPSGIVSNRDVVIWAQALACGGIATCLPMLSSPYWNKLFGFLRRVAPVAASFSYSLYLFHFPILLILTKWISPMRSVTPQTISAFVLIVVITVATAWLLYLPFERQTPLVRAWLNKRFVSFANSEVARGKASQRQ